MYGFGFGHSGLSSQAWLSAAPANRAFADAVDAIGSVAFHYPTASGGDRLDASRTLTANDAKEAISGKASFTDSLGGAVALRSSGKGRMVGNAAAATAASFARTQPFSVSCFVSHMMETDYAANVAMTLVGKALSATPFTGWALQLRRYTSGTIGRLLRFEIASDAVTSVNVRSNVEVSSAAPHMLTATYDGSGTAAGIKLYLDGADVTGTTAGTTMSSGSTQGAADFMVGARGSNAGTPTEASDAIVGDVVGFTKALTAGEVASLYAARAQRSLGSGIAASIFPDPAGPTSIIYDDDCDSDVDGANNVALLSKLVQMGQVDLKAAICTSNYEYATAAMDIMFKYASSSLSTPALATVPMGAWTGSLDVQSINDAAWVQPLVNEFRPTGLRVRGDFPTALTAYRTALAGASNASVVIVIGGSMQSFAQLLESPADGISALTGLQLVAQKVKFVSFCGTREEGTGLENNVRFGLQAARDAFHLCPVPMILSTVDNWTTPTVQVKGATTDAALTSGNPFKYAWRKWGVANAQAADYSRAIGDIEAIMFGAFGRNAGMFQLNNYPHTVLIHASGDVTPRSPYPGRQLGMVGKVASDVAIQTAAQSLIDAAAGT